MALASPGVEVKEIDLTTIVPSAASTAGAFAGEFFWGPVNERVLITSENELKRVFGEPKTAFRTDAANQAVVARDFMVAAGFSSYSNSLWVVRAAHTVDGTPANEASNGYTYLAASDPATPVQVLNRDDFEGKVSTDIDDYFIIAKWPGIYGNSIGVSAAFSASQYSGTVPATDTYEFDSSAKTITNTTGVPTIDFTDYFAVGDSVTFSYSGVTYRNTVASVTATVVTVETAGSRFPASDTTGAATSITHSWKYAANFAGAPGTNEFHLVLYDATGDISGSEGTILETYGFVSTQEAALYEDGTSAYWRTNVNDKSAFAWAGEEAVSGAPVTADVAYYQTAGGGTNGIAATIGDRQTAYDKFASKDDVDISLVISGAASDTLKTYLVNNIAEVRKDCVVFVSPNQSDVVNVPDQELDNVVATRNATGINSSYAFMTSNWIYRYDRYNNVFRWIPDNGDVAGICARSDASRDSWWSPAGFNRGVFSNVRKLAWNPNNAQRNVLYQNGVNPVVNFTGAGNILFGDKTLLSRPSAFDRLNVRRLFIVLEKAIERASRFSLFEFNDEFTRSRFVALVEPFLRDIKGRRGVTDFLVVCDETNNTGQVIDSNRFIGDIYVKPNRSINFITLNFVAVGTGVEFSEVVGQF